MDRKQIDCTLPSHLRIWHVLVSDPPPWVLEPGLKPLRYHVVWARSLHHISAEINPKKKGNHDKLEIKVQ